MNKAFLLTCCPLLVVLLLSSSAFAKDTVGIEKFAVGKWKIKSITGNEKEEIENSDRTITFNADKTFVISDNKNKESQKGIYLFVQTKEKVKFYMYGRWSSAAGIASKEEGRLLIYVRTFGGLPNLEQAPTEFGVPKDAELELLICERVDVSNTE